jgi:hypothetical protein
VNKNDAQLARRMLGLEQGAVIPAAVGEYIEKAEQFIAKGYGRDRSLTFGELAVALAGCRADEIVAKEAAKQAAEAKKAEAAAVASTK